jgi:ribokinase
MRDNGRADMQKSDESFNVLGIGVAVRDVAVLLDQFPTPNEKFQAKGFYEAGGGPIPTALVTLTRLGRRTAFCGVVGEGVAGRFITESLEKEGVDTSGLVIQPGFSSSTSVILVEGGHRTIIEWKQEDLPLRFEELEAQGVSFDFGGYLLVDARLPEVQIEAARRVRRAGGRVVLDCGHPRPGVEEILDLTDVAIFSYTYPKSLHGESYDTAAFLAEIADRLPENGSRIAGLTLGAEGCALLAPGSSLIRIPGHSVNAVDSTGAGDVFHGAFVHAFAQGRSPEESARFANAAAALGCTGITGRSPLPAEEVIWRLARGQ